MDQPERGDLTVDQATEAVSKRFRLTQRIRLDGQLIVGMNCLPLEKNKMMRRQWAAMGTLATLLVLPHTATATTGATEGDNDHLHRHA